VFKVWTEKLKSRFEKENFNGLRKEIFDSFTVGNNFRCGIGKNRCGIGISDVVSEFFRYVPFRYHIGNYF
jgi:hypothetical protein